jgi:hypothetical protein
LRRPKLSTEGSSAPGRRRMWHKEHFSNKKNTIAKGVNPFSVSLISKITYYDKLHIMTTYLVNETNLVHNTLSIFCQF